MKPAPFAYHDPSDLDSAVRLLAELGDGAKVLAGGQSLMPMLNLRHVKPKHLVDLSRVASLFGIGITDGTLVVGAMTTHRTIETSPVVHAVLPLLSEAASHINHIPIRERGTIGGSLSHADPAAELPLASVVLDAELTIQSVRGRRQVPAAQFFHAGQRTDLAADEILTGISFPLPAASTGSAFIEFSRRKGDPAIVGVAVMVGIADGRYVSARIGLCGVSDRPFRSVEAGSLVGAPVGDSTTSRIAEAIATEIDPVSDHRAGAQDRRDIARALVGRALALAAGRAALDGPARKGDVQ